MSNSSKKYPLDKLVKIRKLRADIAQSRLIKKKAILTEAKKRHEEMQNALSEFNQWRKNEEERLYSDINNATVSSYAFDEYNNKLIHMRSEALDLESHVNAALKEIDKAEQDTAQAQKEYHQIEKKILTLEEHYATWLEQIKQEELQAEDSAPDD